MDFFCVECDGHSFASQQDLEEHVAWFHMDLNYTCPFCPVALSSRVLRRQHMLQNHAIPLGPTFICQHHAFPVQKSNVAGMENHNKSAHKDRKHSCDDCHMVFKRKAILATHDCLNRA